MDQNNLKPINQPFYPLFVLHSTLALCIYRPILQLFYCVPGSMIKPIWTYEPIPLISLCSLCIGTFDS